MQNEVRKRINSIAANGLPVDQLWDEELSVIEDQLYSVRGITDPAYRLAVELVIEAKKEAPG